MQLKSYIKILYKKFIVKSEIKAFTLIELIVAMALFITTMTIAVGALFSVQSSNVRLQANQVILDGMNLSFELMSREIRYGSVFYCGNDTLPFAITTVTKRKSCPLDDLSNLNAGGNMIVFQPVDAASPDDRVGFYVASGKLYEWSYVSGFVQTPKQITSDDVVISTLHFFVTGANTTQQAVTNGNIENSGATTDILQPAITAVITGTIDTKERNYRKKIVNFSLQTTITSRALDF